MRMQKVKVLRTVLVADATIFGREIVAGTEDEVSAALFDGLAKEGYVEAVKVAAVAPVAEPAIEVSALEIEDRAEPYRRKRK